MQCHKCQKKAVLSLQHGALCTHHFIEYFEKKVFKTIKKFRLIGPNDVLCVAASGGKDSLTILYLAKKFIEQQGWHNKLFALCVDEGIAGYRAGTITDLRAFCKEHDIAVTVVATKDLFGHTLDEAYPKVKTAKKPCNICGVWRRYVLNKKAREMGASKLLTGHNLDDEAQAILMNVFKANTKLAAHLGPISGVDSHELFVQRVKPLYFCSEKETRLYTFLKKFKVDYSECPYSREGYRSHIRDMLNDFESQYKGTKHGIVQSFLALLPMLKEKVQDSDATVQVCSTCGEPANGDVCNACKIHEVLQND